MYLLVCIIIIIIIDFIINVIVLTTEDLARILQQESLPIIAVLVSHYFRCLTCAYIYNTIYINII